MRPVRALLGAGVGLVVLGGALLGRSIGAYLADPAAPSSTSGVRVFRLPDGSLGAYETYATGYEPIVIGVGLVLVVAALVLGSFLRPRMY